MGTCSVTDVLGQCFPDQIPGGPLHLGPQAPRHSDSAAYVTDLTGLRTEVLGHSRITLSPTPSLIRLHFAGVGVWDGGV